MYGSPDNVLGAMRITSLQHLYKLLIHSFGNRQHAATNVVWRALQYTQPGRHQFDKTGVTTMIPSYPISNTNITGSSRYQITNTNTGAQ